MTQLSNVKSPMQRDPEWPSWFTGNAVDENQYCSSFLQTNKLAFTESAFFSPKGKLDDETPLKSIICKEISPYVKTNVANKIRSIVELLKIKAYVEDLPPLQDRIHLSNGTLYLDGHFDPTMDEVVRGRLPVAYAPDAPAPEHWLAYLEGLLFPEDILTFQEFIGYLLIPSNKAQRLMIVKGDGGEGKSVSGFVLKKMFGHYAKDGSVAKISENAFARADLEFAYLMIDDDMRMDALRQTNYVKSLVTAQGRMDLEKKKQQSYQGYVYARILAFSNGDLQSLYDRSGGFYRRQLILTTKEKDPNRRDDPDLGQKLCEEIPGVLLWAFEGLKRLVANDFKFTESTKVKANRDMVRQDGNNLLLFMESEDYFELGDSCSVSSKELYAVYCTWCDENGFAPMKARTLSDFLVANQKKYGIVYTNDVYNAEGRRVRGFKGIRLKVDTGIRSSRGFQKVYIDDNPFEQQRIKEY